MELNDIAAALDDLLDEYMEDRSQHLLIAVSDRELDTFGVGHKHKEVGDRVVTVSILQSRPRMDSMYADAAEQLGGDIPLTLIYREVSR